MKRTSFRQSHVPKRGTLVPGRAEMQNSGRGGGWGLGRRRERRNEERLTYMAAPIGCSSNLLKLDGAFGVWRMEIFELEPFPWGFGASDMPAAREPEEVS